MTPDSISNKKICLSALNWGMGHVSRTISLINKFLNQQNIVFFAGNEHQIQVLKSYFNDKITYLILDDYPFKFKGKGDFYLDLLLNLKQLKKQIKLENKVLENWNSTYNFDIIISDHRYGFYNSKTKSIFLTHQINLPLAKLIKWINHFHLNKLKKFDLIWVPDFSNRQLSGELSKSVKKIKIEYIGPLSRFELYSDIKTKKINDKIIVVVSGPDPYAKLFLEEQVKRFNNNKNVTFILPRKLNSSFEKEQTNIYYADDWTKTDYHFLTTEKIISRSGYSTIMDNYFLKKSIELIPTKGQWEQEYLAILHR